MARRYTMKSHDGKWGMTRKGEVYKLGKYGYFAGYCSRPDDRDAFEAAVEAAEEETRVLMAQARREFGL